MQPYLFPYIGYFQLINAADIFILYDDVNFRKQSWINRNRILLNGSIHTFTIPCKGISSNKLIKEIELNNKQDFEHNFLKLLGHGYEKKAPYFDEIIRLLKKIFNTHDTNSISSFNYASTSHICDYLGIKTEIKQSSECSSHTSHLKGSKRLYSICKQFDAKTYINASGGKELYCKSDFIDEGLNLKFITPEIQKLCYNQISTKLFTPWLSIIDVLMNNSKEECQTMLNCSSLS